MQAVFSPALVAAAPSTRNARFLLSNLGPWSAVPGASTTLREQNTQLKHDARDERQRDGIGADAAAVAPPVAAAGRASPSSDATHEVDVTAERSIARNVQRDGQQKRQNFERALSDAAAQRRAQPSAAQHAPAADLDAHAGATTSDEADAPGFGATRTKPEVAAPASAAAENGAEVERTRPPTAKAPAVDASGSRQADVGGRALMRTPIASAGPAVFEPNAVAPSSSVDARSAAAGIASVSTSQPLARASMAAGGAPAAGATSVAGTSAASFSQSSASRGFFRTPTTSNDAAMESNSDAQSERIVRFLRAQLSQKSSSAQIRLDPPNLGTLRIQMDLRADVLALRFDTDTHLAHELLKSELDSLRRGLESSGLVLERVEIRPPAASSAVENPDPAAAFFDQPAGREAAQDGSADRETFASGREASGGDEPAAGAAALEITEPAAESLVNILA